MDRERAARGALVDVEGSVGGSVVALLLSR